MASTQPQPTPPPASTVLSLFQFVLHSSRRFVFMFSEGDCDRERDSRRASVVPRGVASTTDDNTHNIESRNAVCCITVLVILSWCLLSPVAVVTICSKCPLIIPGRRYPGGVIISPLRSEGIRRSSNSASNYISPKHASNTLCECPVQSQKHTLFAVVGPSLVYTALQLTLASLA